MFDDKKSIQGDIRNFVRLRQKNSGCPKAAPGSSFVTAPCKHWQSCRQWIPGRKSYSSDEENNLQRFRTSASGVLFVPFDWQNMIYDIHPHFLIRKCRAIEEILKLLQWMRQSISFLNMFLILQIEYFQNIYAELFLWKTCFSNRTFLLIYWGISCYKPHRIRLLLSPHQHSFYPGCKQ